jgi:hypothetical protein
MSRGMAKPARRRFAGCGLAPADADAPCEAFEIPENALIFNIFTILEFESATCVSRTAVV